MLLNAFISIKKTYKLKEEESYLRARRNNNFRRKENAYERTSKTNAESENR
jgi:hypothetical protein